MSGILRLESLTKGNTLKQGDKTPLKYRMFDADGEKLNIAGKSAKVRLVYPDFLTIGYEKDGLTVAQDDTVTFTIDKLIPAKLYHVEIIVGDEFIFPSRADESKFTVDKSSLGADANIIEIIGKDAVIRDIMAKEEIQNVLDSKQIAEEAKIISETANQNVLDVEARQTQVEQFNNQVVTEMTDKDVISAPEIILARGEENTLGERLDKEHSEVNAKLAQIMINVKSFGAVGNGVTDDLLAIQTAINEAKKVEGSTLYFPPSVGDYMVSDTLNIPPTLNVEMIGRVSYSGVSHIPVVAVGSTGVIIHKKRLTLNATRKNQSDWSNEENIAVKIYNATTSFIKIIEASRATIGVQVMGDGRGFSYNHFELGALQENKIAVDITNDNGGWCNENLFLSGRFATMSSNNQLGSRYGVRITSKNNYINNNNVFFKPSFELGGTIGESIPLLVEWGAGTQVLNARDESPYPITAKFENGSGLNYVGLNYGTYQQIDTSTYSTNYGDDWRMKQLKSLDRLIFTSLAIKDSLTGEGALLTSDKYFFNNRDGGTEITSNGLGILKTPTGLSISGVRGIGLRFYVTDSRKFLLDRVGVGHFAVRLFNSDDVLLTSGLKFAENMKFAWTTNYGGSFVIGSPHEQPAYFEIPDDASYFDIIFFGELSQFNLYSDRVGAVGINPLTA